MKLLRALRPKKPDISRRVVPDRSGRELVDLEAHYGHHLHCTVYFYADKRVLAAPQAGKPGFVHAELREPLVLEDPADDAELGFAALHAMLQFDSTLVELPVTWKATDWPTFRRSGARSVKAFNRECCTVRVETTQGGGMQLEASCLLPQDTSIAVRGWVPVSVVHSELGQMLRKLVKGARILQENGVV